MNGTKRDSANSSPQNKAKKQQQNHRKSGNLNLAQEKKKSNTVTISKTSAAPINWAAQLKGKQSAIKQKNGSGKSNDFDSSQGVSMDAMKVRHVLEVFNMTPSDYQKVSSIFKHFKIDSLI